MKESVAMPVAVTLIAGLGTAFAFDAAVMIRCGMTAVVNILFPMAMEQERQGMSRLLARCAAIGH